MKTEFKVCSLDMVDELIGFIDEHWRKDHIFTRDRKLFDWQHKNGDQYNFVLAMRGKEIIAILGFIPTSQFSKTLEDQKEAWLAIWKVRDDIRQPGLGLLMLKFLKKELDLKLICSLGLSKQVVPIYKALKYEVGILNHFAFFNQTISNFSLVQPPNNYLAAVEHTSFSYQILNENDSFNGLEHLFASHPKKDVTYIKNRYINHPVYKYEVVVIFEKNEPISLFIYRVNNVDDVLIARIVDMQGESILDSRFNHVISDLVSDKGFDYIDIVTNINSDKNSGFRSNASDQFVIPNYFEPFELKNISIDYAYQTENPNVRIFRGDSDQDRPNL
ncbi:hypothetical protein [Vibrio penaeicida]|uniref:hypothetical protein n=1 Tax=Vibrio penaeicida TaxID=104609 RepID=UPI000CEA6639|nr:hypothetical protein [Vibrio penaeicida]